MSTIAKSPLAGVYPNAVGCKLPSLYASAPRSNAVLSPFNAKSIAPSSRTSIIK